MQILAFDLNASDDLGGQVVVSGSNNLIRSQNNFESITISSDDPLLGALSNNGGPTLTHSLSVDSPAIGHGSNLLNLVNDQRGATYGRVVGSAIDIGAFELQTVATPGLPGDYNGNQSVDAADFVIWRKTFGANVPQYSGADGNGSSKIDDGDYDVWRGNFGAPSSGSGATATSQSSLITVEAQPDVPGAQRNDLVLAATLASRNGLLSARSGVRDHNRLNKHQTTSPVSRQARDEALLAILGGPIERPISDVRAKLMNGELELHAAQPAFSDLSLLESVLRTSKLTI